MKILVVGWGGRSIGSHLVRRLVRAGHQTVVLDNLCSGFTYASRYGQLFRVDVSDAATVRAVLAQHLCDAVMHFGSHNEFGDSVADPAKYYGNNTSATLELLKAIREAEISRFIFSQTDAVYGVPSVGLAPESHPLSPINPYGRSNLMVDEMLEDFDADYGLKSVVLRYFNVAGADPDDKLGERHQTETHLIPLVLQAAVGRRASLSVFGRDYPTRDGTCVRDYIYVTDLANAHQLAEEHLLESKQSDTFNFCTGKGYTVVEVIDAAIKVTGRALPVVDMPRRHGGPAELVAAPGNAMRKLCWKPRLSDLER